MIQYEYMVQFHAPAFLGNAEQNGQWRTPPFKALLRHWWRIAHAAEQGFANLDWRDMRNAEGELFGIAADERNGSRKSRLRLRLDHWSSGRLTAGRWEAQEYDPRSRIRHPEVDRGPIDPLLYLGYGPLQTRKVMQSGRSSSVTTLKKNAAIQAGETATLSLAFPQTYQKRLDTTLQLLHLYATIGGRSRNGWGSFGLSPVNEDTPALAMTLDRHLLHDWHQALQFDWPHAIGRDDHQPLIWRTAAAPDWNTLMRTLAELKIALRTRFRFTTGRNAPHPQERHWLSYPVTNHSVQNWDRMRLPNSLRFKIRQDNQQHLYAVIVHVPCAPPRAFRHDRNTLEQVWQKVHRFLDDPALNLHRIEA